MSLRSRPRSFLVALVFSLVACVRVFAGETIDFALIVDESGSMEHSPPKSDVGRLRVDAAKLFVELCGSEDRVLVVGFGDRVTMHSGPTFQRVDDRWKTYLARRLNSLGGNQAHTDMLSGLRNTLGVIQDREQKSAKTFIVFLTDGKVTGPGDLPREYLQRYSADEYVQMLLRAATECGQEGAPLLCIGLGSGVDESFLQSLAAQSGGRYYRAEDPTKLQQIYSDIFVNLADRFSLYKSAAHSPVDVELEDGLEEFVALAFPRTAPHTRAPFKAGFELVDPQGNVAPIQTAATRSWALARLKAPAGGKWQVRFDPRLDVDILLVKDARCRIQLRSPSKPEYPLGPVPIDVLVHDPSGRPSDGCANQMRARIEGPGLSSAATVDLVHSGTGQFTGATPSLDKEGDYVLTLEAFSGAGQSFANRRVQRFRVKDLPVPKPRLVLHRPDAAAYLTGGAVPVEAQVTVEGKAPRPGEVRVEARITGPSATGPIALSEVAPGVFRGATPILDQEGDHRVEVNAKAGPDVRSQDAVSRQFHVQAPPVETLALAFASPASGTKIYPGRPQVALAATGDGGAPVDAGTLEAHVDVSGPGASQKVSLTAGDGGALTAIGPVLTRPGTYTLNASAHRKSDPRSLATATTQLTVVAPTVQIAGVHLEGPHPLAAGESMVLAFEVRTRGTTGSPRVDATVWPPVTEGQAPAGQTTSVPLDTGPVARGRINVPGVLLGAYRVDLKARATSAAGTELTTQVAVPVEVALAVKPDTASVPGWEPSTATVLVHSTFRTPVTVRATGGHSRLGTLGASTGPSPLVTTAGTVALAPPESGDEEPVFTAVPFGVEPPSEGLSGDYVADVDLEVSGRYPSGAPWSRTLTVPATRVTLESPPVSGFVWLLLAALAGAVFWVRPSFGGCRLTMGDETVALGPKAGLWGRKLVLGGPGHDVEVCDEDVTPVVIRAGWLGRYERETSDALHPLVSGEPFQVGRTAVTFLSGRPPAPRTGKPSSPAGGDSVDGEDGGGPPTTMNVDDIA